MPFKVASDEVRNWRDLVDSREGFANLNLADIFQPDREKLEALSRRCLLEDSQAENATERNRDDVTQTLSASTNSFQSFCNENEFLI